MRRTLTLVSVFTLLLGVLALPAIAEVPENPPDYTFTNAQIPTGNAGAECAALGELLDVEFMYAYKFNADPDSEGALNETETANFHVDGELVHSNTVTILNSDGKVFDWTLDPTTSAPCW
jgi:hypothetical protein